MDVLLDKLRGLAVGGLKARVDGRVGEFRECGRKPVSELFSELCFCILTANYNAEGAINIQRCVGYGFIELPEESLAEKLRVLGHRYPNARASYIVEARKHIPRLEEVLGGLSGLELREWFVENVKGLGYKEASHFLRNVGYTDYAILDFHIIDVLVEYGLIERPKTLTKNKYLEVEELLRDIAAKAGLNLSELDLYLWYMETGKILK